MSYEKRPGKPFMWPTWITGLLAGEDHCQWAPWFKAHFKGDKRPDPEREKLFRESNIQHDEMVLDLHKELVEQNLVVTIEKQNSFKVTGRYVLVSGVMDVVSGHEPAGPKDPDDPHRQARLLYDGPLKAGTHIAIWDCKGGQARPAHAWQVRIYLMMYPHTLAGKAAQAAGQPVHGFLVYKDRRERIDLTDADTARIAQQLQVSGSPDPPPFTPSKHECGFCSIADCPERIEDQLEGETEEF